MKTLSEDTYWASVCMSQFPYQLIVCTYKGFKASFGLQLFILSLSVCADVSQRACGSADHSQVKWKVTTRRDNEMSGHSSAKVHKTKERPQENAKQYVLKVNCPQGK